MTTSIQLYRRSHSSRQSNNNNTPSSEELRCCNINDGQKQGEEEKGASSRDEDVESGRLFSTAPENHCRGRLGHQGTTTMQASSVSPAVLAVDSEPIRAGGAGAPTSAWTETQSPSESQSTASTISDTGFRKMKIESSSARANHEDDTKSHSNLYQSCCCSEGCMQSHWPIYCISFFIFAVLAGAGIAVCLVVLGSQDDNRRNTVMDLAAETGHWFAKELDYAILPLFSMAQFASELEVFKTLPNQIKDLPFVPNPPNTTQAKAIRNVTGVCDQPELVQRFTEIATTVKENAKMDGVLHSIQLAPQGIICLLHPMNNTEDFHDGKYLDNSGAWGIDLLQDPFHRFLARQSMQQGTVGIVGPRRLLQCPTCGLYFIVRLPVMSRHHVIDIDGQSYPRWGFATALINWEVLVQRSDIYQRLNSSELEFQLTRTDHNYNNDTNSYEPEVVVLASSGGFGTKSKQVSTALQTTNNEWVITIQYDTANDWHYILISFVSVVVALFIAALVYTVLVQKQTQTELLGSTKAEKAKVELERHLTASLAHELRNPLAAIDSALACMPLENAEAKELVASMQLCSGFMSSIMNNLLDSRKLEEGKLTLLSNPFSLKTLLYDVRKMMAPAMNKKVRFVVDVSSLSPQKEWVFGDAHRLQQVITNLVSNSVKFTRQGSITLSAKWVKHPSAADKNGCKYSDEWVQLMCRDTGPGIPKGDQAEMFNRFTTRGGAPGSGLGLSIARQLVDLMQGSIRFESDPTVKPGTDCIVMLPLKVCDIMKVEQTTSSVAVDVRPLESPLKILVTDDIKMNRMMLKRRLQKCVAPNCTITEAATGEEALKICETERFDIIIMDQYMQEASGVLVGTDVIIALRRSKVDAIVIGCSGNDLDDKFKAAGADLVWQKPIPSNEEIITSLRALLATKIQEV